jgi:hypothetical protein
MVSFLTLIKLPSNGPYESDTSPIMLRELCPIDGAVKRKQRNIDIPINFIKSANFTAIY